MRWLYALFSILSVVFVSGCTAPGQPVGARGGVPILSSARGEPAPRLMAINHLFTVKGHFSRPAGIAVDVQGSLYVADSGKSAIYVLDANDGKLLESIGRFGWRSGEFDGPADVAVDAQLRLYIADSGNNRVQRFSLINRSFSVVAGEKQNESGRSISLSEPQSVAADVSGYVYIADTWNHRILKIDPLGRLQMEIGGLGWAGQQFRNPRGVTVDFRNNIYISDTGNHRVHKLDFSGSQIAIWGEEGTGEGQFRNPAGQSIDRFGNVYVADQGNHRVQIFSPEGRYLAEFGRQVLDDPVDVAVDNDFRAYVTDSGAGDIEVFRIIYEMAEDVR
jgi:DNA-binding beta-propeller fold protein YncE